MNTFSIKRVQLLCSRYFIEHWKKDVMVFGILLIVNIFLGVFLTPGNDLGFSAFLVSGALLISASNIFYPLKSKKQTLDYLMLPASSLEKTTTNIFLIHIYQFLGVLIFTFAGLFIGKIIGAMAFPMRMNPLSFNLFFNVFNIEFIVEMTLFLALFIFGSVYFKKNAFIKTFLFLIAFIFIIALVDVGIIVAFLETDAANINNSSVSIVLENDFNFGLINGKKAGTLFCICYTLIFWVMSFYRLRETEV